jgi:hypothetical protein
MATLWNKTLFYLGDAIYDVGRGVAAGSIDHDDIERVTEGLMQHAQDGFFNGFCLVSHGEDDGHRTQGSIGSVATFGHRLAGYTCV